jgi:hypothetical protein
MIIETTSGTTPEGAWQVETYVVKGSPTAVDGMLLLTAGRWSTLYFVPRPAGPWASAEAGAYKIEGDTLTFYHRLLFQGGGASALEINQTADRVEVCTVQVDGTRMAISFPSGNTLHCQRFES